MPEIRISRKDLLKPDYTLGRGESVVILHAIKSAGGPVYGTTYPRADFENYEWNQFIDQQRNELVIQWKKKDDV